jgi:hypothetical protein
VALLALLLCGSSGLKAQLAVTTATLSGTVTDPTGALVPKASVKLVSTQNGVSRTFVTDAGGHYSFTQLPPSNYVLTIQEKGFKAYQQKGIVLDAGQSATQDVVLTLGSEDQEVVVTSQASLLNTDNANISADIDAKQVVELPLNLRNVYGLATLNSSVNNTSEGQMLLGGGGPSTDDADQDISFLNFAGGFFGTSAYLLDGAWDTDPEWGAVIYVPSVDAVQEFKVQNNSFTAQYGWSTGNVVNVVSKSGTSQFHGDVYEFYRNSALDANSWFANHNGVARLNFNRQQYGGSAGGPLYIPGLYKQREKTFVFGLYEHLTLSSPSDNTFTVPDTRFLAGDFSEILGAQGTDAHGNPAVDALGRAIHIGQIYDPHSTRAITQGQVDPKTGLIATQSGYIRDPITNNNVAALAPIDPLAQKLIGYYPTATGSGVSNNLFVAGTAPANSDEYLIRVDHNINDAARLYFRYSYKREFKTGTPAYWGGSNPAGPGNARPNNRYNMAAGYSQIFSPTFTMNVNAGVELWHETSTNQSRGFKPSSLGLPSYLDANSPEFPVVAVGSQSPLGPLTNETVTNHGPVGSVALDFIKVHGHHTVNFGFMGVELEDDQANFFESSLDSNGTFTSGPNPNASTGFSTGNGLAQLMLGVLDGGAAGTTYNPAVAMHYFGGYVQDDWTPLPKLTLNLGIRYEIQTAPTYRHNVASVFNPTAPNPIGEAIGQTTLGALQFLSSSNRSSYDANYNNIAPRFGFSYQALPKLVLRGGYGIFYPQSISCCFMASASGFASQTNVPFTLDAISPNPAVTTTNPWPNGFIPITGNTLGELQQVGNGLSSNFRSRSASYVQQYLFGFQYGITNNDEVEVHYVGNHGTHMMAGTLNRSQLDPKYLPMGQAALNTLVPNPYYGAIDPTVSSCNLGNPTIVQSQLLQPYSQFCGVTENDAPAGFSIYNALQVSYNHRISKGLTALVSYTYSKFLDNVEGNNSWSYTGNQGPANNYNLAAEKSVDGSDIPHSLVANYVYQLPIGRGKAVGGGMNRLANAVVGGWEVSQIATFKQGIPLSISGNDIASYGGNPRPDVIGNTHVAHPSIHEWFNTAAFSYAQYGTFGTAPRFFSNLRGPGYQNWDTSLMKNWHFTESMRLQFRAELYNTFNHPQFYAPAGGGESYTGCDPNASSNTNPCASSLGQITNTFPNRTVQFAGKFYW